MDATASTMDNNVDKPKEFFKIAGSFHLVTFNGLLLICIVCVRCFITKGRVNIRRCFLLLSDGFFDIPLKYLESKIGAIGRPRENKAGRVGWNAWCCGDETSEMDSGTVSSRMDESVPIGEMRKKISCKESC